MGRGIPMRLRTFFTFALLLLLAAGFCEARVCMTDSFDDGDWTTTPAWTCAPAGAPISVTGEANVSPPFSLKVSAVNQQGAVSTGSGLWGQPFECTFNLYIQSMGDEAIPLALRASDGSAVAVLFLFSGGKGELFVSDSTSTYHGLTVKLSSPITLGCWHAVRMVYDGQTTSIYLDGSGQPLASVQQTYVETPSQITVGNFGPAHTSTFYLDDIKIAGTQDPTPGRIYIQFCSDTSTSGINLDRNSIPFSPDDESYSSPTGQAAQVMSELFRSTHLDSQGTPIKFTWYMLVGSVYSAGTVTGPLLPFELMQDNHGEEIARWGDEMAYHYHTWIWSDPDGDGVYHWNQAPGLSYCVQDFDSTLAHLVLDRGFYPSSFRSGWHAMDNYYQCYLDAWIPFRFENCGGKHDCTTEPINNVLDWSHAPTTWAPYHPDPNDYQSPGSLRGWDSRCDYTPGVTGQMVQDIFTAALSGTSQYVTFWSHLKETDFPTQVDRVHQLLTAAHALYPDVEFHYVTARESMRNWQNSTDVTPPELRLQLPAGSGVQTATVTTNEPIYQLQPFVASRTADGVCHRLDCTTAGVNTWTVQVDTSNLLQLAAAATDWCGNATVCFAPLPLKISALQAVPQGTTATVSWDTSGLAYCTLTCQKCPDGPVQTVSPSLRRTRHSVQIEGLQPETVYRLQVTAHTAEGQQADPVEMYILTRGLAPVIVDNSDPGFSAAGNWTTGNSAAGHYGADYLYAMASTSGTSSARWVLNAPRTGLYRVCVWWSDGDNRSIAAPYTVEYAGRQVRFAEDQQVNGGQWNTLGTLDLTAGDTVTVTLANNTGLTESGKVVIADAAMLDYVTPPHVLTGYARLLADGTALDLGEVVVSAVFPDAYYVQTEDRSAGCRVEGCGVERGNVIRLCGQITHSGAEVTLTSPVITQTGRQVEAVPLVTRLRDICLDGADRTTTAGLLLRVSGRVVEKGTGWFSVQDGSAEEALRVQCGDTSVALPEPGEWADVTGVLAAYVDGVQTRPLLRMRDAKDLRPGL